MDHDHASNSISVSVNAAAAAAAAESNISSSGNSSPNLWRSRIGNTMDAATGSTSTGIATTTSGSLMQPPVYSNNPSLLTPLEKKQRRTNDYQSFYANTQKKHRAHQAPDANNLQDIFKQLNDAITNSKISPMNNHGLNNVMNSSSSSSPAHASPHDTPLPINKPHHHKHFFINNQNNIPPFSDDNHMLLSTDPVIMEDVDSSIVKETQLGW